MRRLNDFTGHRPVATLGIAKARALPQRNGSRPVPIYIQGVGVACGRYHDLLTDDASL